VVDALNRGSPDDFAAHFAVDATVSFMQSGRQIHGRDAIRQWLAEAFTRIESLRNEVVFVHGDDRTVTLEVRATGFPTATFAGAVPGQPWAKAEAYVYEIDRDLIIQARCYL
jgi:ketosteroid isomerase-like protein